MRLTDNINNKVGSFYLDTKNVQSSELANCYDCILSKLKTSEHNFICCSNVEYSTIDNLLSSFTNVSIIDVTTSNLTALNSYVLYYKPKITQTPDIAEMATSAILRNLAI